MLCMRSCAVVEQGGERCGAPPRVDDESEPSTDDEIDWRGRGRASAVLSRGRVVRLRGAEDDDSKRHGADDDDGTVDEAVSGPRRRVGAEPTRSSKEKPDVEENPSRPDEKRAAARVVPTRGGPFVVVSTPYDDVRDARLRLLLTRQARALPMAADELRAHGRKLGHWAWWAFPTEKPGSAEPTPKTAVTLETAPELVRRAPPEWRGVLELIVDLVESAGDIGEILPPIDHGRIIYFIKFWRDLEDTPVWLRCVINKLNGFLTCPMPVTGSKATALAMPPRKAARPAATDSAAPQTVSRVSSAGAIRILGPADQCPQRPW